MSNKHSNGDGVSGISKFVNKVLSLIGLRPKPSLKESVEEVLEEHEATGEPASREQRILRNVLTFGELTVEDVMIPRADIVYVNEGVTPDALKKLIAGKAHTRMPVCRENLDDVAGFIHLKDVVMSLAGKDTFDIGKILRKALFVPPSMKISNLLVRMQLSRVHMALVVDEYGGTSGLVTLEDVVEEIVGEIEDEHDVLEKPALLQISQNSYEASARISIEELEQKLSMQITRDDEDDYDTLGGLIFSLLGRVPAQGELARYVSKEEDAALEFEIVEADLRRIKRVLVRKQ